MFDLITIIKTAGYFGLFGMIFAETGLLFGFVFPGDSLLFTAGILASQGYLNIAVLIFVFFLGVLAGDNTGYYLGWKLGPKIFNKEESFFFKKSHLKKSQEFFEKYGAKTLVIARFVPVVRTFAPTLAGVGKMKYYKFLTFSLIGSMLWSVGLTLLGYFLGSKIPNIDTYLLPIIALIIILSISPYLYKFFTNKQLRLQIYAELKKLVAKK